MSRHQFEVVCLQSLACLPGNLPRLEGYYYPPVVGPVSPRDKVMACIYIRHNVLFSNEPNITGPPNGYTCGVRVRVQGQLDFMIVNCYTPQPCTSFDWLTELGGKGRCLVTGDFNVRDSSWERDYESSSSTLTAQIDNSDFIVLNDGSFTRIPDCSDQRPSAIDLTLVTPDTASGAEWEVGADSLSSDHLPITVSFVFSAEKETPATTSKYNYDLANWDLFRNLLGTAEINVGDADLDEVNRRIVSSILEAAREAIPVTGGGLSRSNSNPWWNKECEEAVRLKRVMYRHYSKDQNAETHERMKAANRDCNKIIAQAKKDHWIAFADSISAGKADLGSVWKKIRRMKQQCVVPDSDLHHGSTKYTTAQSKADALAKAFAEASDTDSLPADTQQFRREMEATFTHPVPDDSLAVKTSFGFHQESQSLHRCGHRLVSDAERGPRIVSEDPAGFLPKMLGWGHNSRGVETRHCRPHPQTRQTEEGARQLQTHLPDIPPRESIRTGDQEQTRILLWVQESVPCVPGRFPTGTGCHRPPGETGWARREGNREEKGSTDVLLWSASLTSPVPTTRSGMPSCYRNSTRSEFLATCTTTSDPSWATDRCRSGGREPRRPPKE